ncbi:MAG: prepilin peptidase [Firmicutes bacterium]|nr:prepilin peptidase [Bacillota bacterium]
MKPFLFFIILYYSSKLPRKIPIYIHLVFLLLLIPVHRMYVPLTALLYCLFLQDLETMYISKKWIAPSIMAGIFSLYSYWNLSSSLAALLFFFFPIFVLYRFKKDWIGSADVCFIGYFSLLLGYQRMSVALLIGTVFGLLFCLIFKKREIPFLCFLVVGVYISCLYGYQLWYVLFRFFIPR